MSKRVLIIDDEPEIRRNLSFGLMQENYTCTACPDGISAIHELNGARAKGIGYDYLITDIFMPDIDGLKILKVIKNDFPELPVLVITGFGDDLLKATALSELNTAYLDKPFEISDLVEALDKLTPGASTLAAPKSAEADKASGAIRESVSAYLTIRITESERSMEIFRELYMMEGIAQCDAVRGDVDIILLAQASSQEKIDSLFSQIRKIQGIEVVSASKVSRPKLDRDIKDFINVYGKTVKDPSKQRMNEERGTTSYIVVDVDKNYIQQIFTTVFFVDEVVFCDVIDDGSKLVGMITEGGAVGKIPKIIEKLNSIDGVLRVREAKIIKLMDF